MTRSTQQASSQRKLSLVLGSIILSLTIVGVGRYLLKTKNNQQLSRVTPIASPTSMSHSSRSPFSTPYSSTEIQEFLSPNGRKKLLFRSQYTLDMNAYSVLISDVTGQHQIYAAQFGKAEFLIAPSKNNWSPNSNYVVVEISAPDAIDPLIFKTDGSTFPNGDRYIDVGELLHKQTGYDVNRTLQWISDTQLELSCIKDLHSPLFNYIFYVEKLTFTKQVN